MPYALTSAIGTEDSTPAWRAARVSLGRTLLLSAALSIVASSALPAQAVATYAPGSRRYHLMSVISRDQEQDGQRSKFTITNEQIVSVMLAAHTKDTPEFTYTMDSSSVAADPPVTLPDISGMKGTRVHGVMSPSGKVYTFTSTAEPNDPDMKNLVDGMTRFLVTLPQHPRVGNKWVDTTTNKQDTNGAHLDLETITTSTILGDTTYDGQRAWRVHRAANLSIAGTQSTLDQTLSVEGHGAGDGFYFISSGGVYLGSTSNQTMKMNVTEKISGKTIPVTQVVTSKVELLP